MLYAPLTSGYIFLYFILLASRRLLNECRGNQVSSAAARKLCLLYNWIRGKTGRQCSLPGHEGQKTLWCFISSCCQHLSVVLNSFYHWTLHYSKQLYQISKSFACCWFYTRMSLSTKPYGILRCWRKLSSIVHECEVFSIVNSFLNEPRLAYTTSQLIWDSSFATTSRTWKLSVSIQLL